VVAVWALGGLAAKRERPNADQELVRDLNSGASVYARLVREARDTADRLAQSSTRTLGSSSFPARRMDSMDGMLQPSTSSAVKGRSGVSLSSLRSTGASSGLLLTKQVSPTAVSVSWLTIGSFARTALAASTRAQRRESRPTYGCRGSNTERSPYPCESSEMRRL
jgi:hypothetical protein